MDLGSTLLGMSAFGTMGWTIFTQGHRHRENKVKLDAINHAVNEVDEGTPTLSSRVDIMSERMSLVNERLDGCDARFDTIDGKLDQLIKPEDSTSVAR